MTEPVVWLNGSLLPASEARVDPAALGFLQGMGVYDSPLLHHGVAIGLDRHVARLAEGARRLGLQTPSLETLREASQSVSRANRLRDARVRITLAVGPRRGHLPPPGATQICLVTVEPLPDFKPQAVVVTVPWRRNEHSPLAGIKFTACAESVLARDAALAGGADEAVFLNTAGDLCEGAFSNIFLVCGGVVLTPPLASGCLPGVMRERVLSLCATHGIPCREETMAGPALPADCTEVFLTSSLRGVQPVERYDDRAFPAPGPVAQSLKAHHATWLDGQG